MRSLSPWVLVLASTGAFGQSSRDPAQSALPDAPSYVLLGTTAAASVTGGAVCDSSSAAPSEASFGPQAATARTPAQTGEPSPGQPGTVDANGNAIPIQRQQPQRILGFMPNFRSVSGGAVAHPPGWRYNFTVATHQALDYSSFLFLGITSLTAEATNSHPALGKGADGFYAYAWRGFLDKTDNTYLSAWLLPSLLHEDTRYYALGHGSILKRSLYVLSREVVARTYGGSDTPNIAGVGGKVLTQYISTYYYPATSEHFSVLVTKFSYSVLRDVGFNSVREFYPDISAYYSKKRHERQLKRGVSSSAVRPLAKTKSQRDASI